MKTRLFATLSAFLLSAVLTAGLWAGPVHATVYFDDSFEGASPISSGWGYSQGACGGSPCQWLNSSTEMPHAGSKSLRAEYPAGALLNEAGTWNQSISRGFPATTDLYIRYWYRTAGFSYGPTTGTKHIYYKGTQAGPTFVSINWFGSRSLGFAAQTPNANIYPNGAPFADNVWYCVEEHVKLNDPGVANGAVEVWVNGTQTIGSYGRLFKSSTNTQVFTYIQIYKQTGSGLMYYDQFAAGNTRIGCSGSVPASDTTLPAPPVGLAIR